MTAGKQRTIVFRCIVILDRVSGYQNEQSKAMFLVFYIYK